MSSSHLLHFAMAFLCLVFECQAKGTDEHYRDAKECFGFNLQENFQYEFRFNVLAEYIYDEMDQQKYPQKKRIDRIRDGIRVFFPKFTTGDYSHRLFFHSGYVEEYSKLPLALKSQLLKVSTPEQLKKYEREILKLLKTEQREFYWAIMAKAKDQYSSLVEEEKKMVAINTLIYDIHLLGDYIDGVNSTREALLEYFELEKSILKAVKDLSCSDKKLVGKFEKDLKETWATSDPERASHALDTMKRLLPDILKNSPIIAQALYKD